MFCATCSEQFDLHTVQIVNCFVFMVLHIVIYSYCVCILLPSYFKTNKNTKSVNISPINCGNNLRIFPRTKASACSLVPKLHLNFFLFFSFLLCVAQSFEALHYEPEDCGFNSWWGLCHSDLTVSLHVGHFVCVSCLMPYFKVYLIHSLNTAVTFYYLVS